MIFSRRRERARTAFDPVVGSKQFLRVRAAGRRSWPRASTTLRWCSKDDGTIAATVVVYRAAIAALWSVGVSRRPQESKTRGKQSNRPGTSLAPCAAWPVGSVTRKASFLAVCNKRFSIPGGVEHGAVGKRCSSSLTNFHVHRTGRETRRVRKRGALLEVAPQSPPTLARSH